MIYTPDGQLEEKLVFDSGSNEKKKINFQQIYGTTPTYMYILPGKSYILSFLIMHVNK
jgi:hypothetical protein